jgi:hypothetical protein
LAGARDFWQPGWNFAHWQRHSDAHHQLTPILLDWARGFNMEGEPWILEGALQTLSDWHRWPQSRDALTFEGFRQYLAESGLITSAEHRFQFEDWGWDPSFSSSAGWLAHVRDSFEKALGVYLV